MQLLSFLTLVASVSAAALPEAFEERNSCPVASSADLAAAKAAFKAANLVNTDLSKALIPKFNPTVKVSASYGSKQVNLGNTFTTTETLPDPKYSFTAEPGYDPAKTKYTVFLVDPDPPNPDAPILKDFLHLETADVQPVCITNQSPKVIAMNMAPTPLSVKPHRYTFLVYRQPPNYVPPPKIQDLPAARNNFDLNGYVKKAGLIGPVGGNFYREGLSVST